MHHRHAVTLLAALAVLAASLAAYCQSGPAASEPVAPAVTAVLTSGEEATLLEFFKAHSPQQHLRLLSLKKANPDTYRTTMLAWHKWMEPIASFPPDVQEACMVQQEAMTEMLRIKARLPAAEPMQREAFAQAIRQQAERHFDSTLVIRRHKIDRLRRQLDQLEKSLDDSPRRRDDNIESMVQQYLQAASSPAQQQR